MLRKLTPSFIALNRSAPGERPSFAAVTRELMRFLAQARIRRTSAAVHGLMCFFDLIGHLV